MTAKQPRHIVEGEGECPPLVPGSLRCYSMMYCPYAQRARLVLSHKNIPFDIVNINLVKKPSWFKARSPQGTVPVLERSDGNTVRESLITMEYLEEAYPEPAILPSDPLKKAEQRIFVEDCKEMLLCLFKVYFAKNTEDRKKAIENFTHELDIVDKKLAELGTPYFAGDKPGYVDLAIWPWFERIPVLKDLYNMSPLTEKHTNLLTWMTVMHDVPAVKALLISPSDHLQFVKTYLAGTPDYDFSL